MLLLAGCSNVPTIPVIGAYKMDIQQGNYVTQEMVAKLKPGMTRAQVRFILGTPLVVDMFRTDRWDYVYVYQKRGAVTEHRRLAVIFSNDKLARIEGDVVPAGSGEAGKGGNAAAEKPKPAADAGSSRPEPAAAPRKPEAAAAAPGQATSNLTTGSGEPVKTEAVNADPAKPESTAEMPKEDKPKDQKPEEEKGFFGRMLDKIGL